MSHARVTRDVMGLKFTIYSNVRKLRLRADNHSQLQRTLAVLEDAARMVVPFGFAVCVLVCRAIL